MPRSIPTITVASLPPSPARSKQMSRVRAKGNKSTELRLIAILKASKISGWRRHPNIFGRPDFVFSKQRIVLFVDGCFWHGCPQHGRLPKSNQEFWQKKITSNRMRDRRVEKRLRKDGWTVIRIWEHELLRANQPRLALQLQHVVPQPNLHPKSRNQPTKRSRLANLRSS
jgi:DNA mismatch endonuclease, patch repair protein